MKHACRILFLFFFIAPNGLNAQNRQALNLEGSVSLALKQGYAVKSATSRYLSSKKNYEAALRRLNTSISFSIDAPRYSESLTSQFNPLTQLYEFYQLQSTSVQGGFTVSQPIVFTGGTLLLQENLFGRDQVSGLTGLSKYGRDYFNNFLVQYRQPLLTPNQYQMSADRASIGIEAARSDFIRSQLDVIYSVTESFYTVYQLNQRLEIARETVSQNEESYKTAKTKFASGLIPEVEVLQSEVDLISSQNELLNSERDLSRAKNAFRLLLGLTIDDDVQLMTTLEYKPVVVDSAVAVEAAVRGRSEILNADRDQELRKLDINLAQSRSGLRLDLQATYGFNRNDDEFGRIFEDLGRTRSASLTLSVPLFDWGSNRLEVEAANVQFDIATATSGYVRQQIRQEVLDAIHRVTVAESRIKVLEKVVAVAQKGYDISLERFRAGTVTRNDLAQAQQRLTQAKINNLNALIDYQVSLADLKRKTVFDFEKNQPVTIREVE